MVESSVRTVLCAAIVLAVVCIGLTAATPAAASHGNDTIEDFEDQDWTPYGDWSSGSHDIVTDPALRGDYSGQITTTDFTNNRWVNSTSISPDNVSIVVEWQQVSHTGWVILERSDGVDIMEIQFSNGDIIVNGNNNVGTFEANKTYPVEFRNIDWGNNEFDVYINDTEYATNVGFQNDNANSIDTIFLNIDEDGLGSATVTVDDVHLSTATEPQPGDGGDIEQSDLRLDVQGKMDHGSTQPYQVFDPNQPIGDTEVTDNATVTSSDPAIISVNDADNTLTATNDTSVAQRVQITATYNNLSTTRNVTVANTTLQNVHILPNEYWIEALITDSTIQWTFLASLFGALVGRVLRNPWVAIGTIESLLLIGWVGAWVTTGLMATSVFSLLAVALTLMQVRKKRN